MPISTASTCSTSTTSTRSSQANLAERAKAAEHASRIVEHEAGQFEHWLRTKAIVPTIRALREQFAQVADAEVGKALDQLARKELTRDQQRELVQRVVQLVVNKLLHQPTTVLRSSTPEDGPLLAATLAELFALEPGESGGEEVVEPPAAEASSREDRKAQA